MADEDLPAEGLSIYFRPPVEEAKVKPVRYDVTGVKVSTDKYKRTTAKGRVENNTDEDAGAMTYVAVLCYNKKGDYMGALWTIVSDGVPAGEAQRLRDHVRELAREGRRCRRDRRLRL